MEPASTHCNWWVYMFRAFWQLAQFRNCVAQIGGYQFACQFRNWVRDFETAQREFLLKLEMAVYITAAMVASSKHTFTPTKLAYEGHGSQHRHTLPTALSSEVFRLYYSDAKGDSGEANATPSTSKQLWKEKGTRTVHVLNWGRSCSAYFKLILGKQQERVYDYEL